MFSGKLTIALFSAVYDCLYVILYCVSRLIMEKKTVLQQEIENLLKIKGNKQAENGGLHHDENISRNRSPSKMTKYIECWGADKPFANITESTMAKNIGLAVSVIVYFVIIYIHLHHIH